jgi:hypothetical protein
MASPSPTQHGAIKQPEPPGPAGSAGVPPSSVRRGAPTPSAAAPAEEPQAMAKTSAHQIRRTDPTRAGCVIRVVVRSTNRERDEPFLVRLRALVEPDRATRSATSHRADEHGGCRAAGLPACGACGDADRRPRQRPAGGARGVGSAAARPGYSAERAKASGRRHHAEGMVDQMVAGEHPGHIPFAVLTVDAGKNSHN